MAISKFKITRKPVRADLKLLGGNITVNQEYFISQQKDLTVDVFGRGVPYDNFGFKLGNENGDWSPEYKCTINALTDVTTPYIIPGDFSVQTGGELDIMPLFFPNDSTDRVKIESVVGNGYFVINGSNAIIGKSYYLYEFINVVFFSTETLLSQNAVATITLVPANANEVGADVIWTITTTGNLAGTIEGEATTTTV